MGRKKETDIALPGDVGNDFQEEDYILTYKPKIEWVQPPDEFLDDDRVIAEDTTLNDARNRVTALVNGYKRVQELTALVSQRVDQRVKSSGGLDIVLDSSVDASAIAAIKRKFPSKSSDKITYDMYKEALKCMAKQAPTPPQITSADIKAAKADPYTTNLGGLGSLPGSLRAEINNPAAMKPVDLKKFQENAVLALFKKMEGLVTAAAKGEVATHEKTKPHS